MKKKTRFVYLVYCNVAHPLVYGVYSSKKSALAYAFSLVEWRFERARKQGYEYGYYHEYTVNNHN